MKLGGGMLRVTWREFQGDVRARYNHISFYTLKFSKNDFFRKEQRKNVS